MKIRNKKTGEVIILIDHTFDNYNSLAGMMDEWEDYEPAGPLIKDEKIRKAVRAWAEVNRINSKHSDITFDFTEHRLKWVATSIEFNMITGLENLKDGESYSIAELCGEEEE